MFYLSLLYGVIVLVGGIVGFVCAQSRASLIAALIGSSLVLWGSMGLHRSKKWGWPFLCAVVCTLDSIFTYRFFLHNRSLTAGGMAAISSIFLLLLLRWRRMKQQK